MSMRSMFLAIGLSLAITGCSVGDESVPEPVDLAAVAYSSDPVCYLEWLNFSGYRRASNERECDHRGGELCHQHCEEVRAGAPGDYYLEILVGYYEPDTYYENWFVKNCYCER